MSNEHKTEVINMVNEVFEEYFEIEKSDLQEDKNLFMDLGLDSLDTVDLIVALQKKFGVKIRDNEKVREVRTLGDIYNFILSVKEESK